MSRRLNKGGGKGGARRQENNRIYAHPLPITFAEPSGGLCSSVLGLLGLSLTKIQRPMCTGYFDPATRAVWVINRDESLLLWRGGFFGKGDLSRSEPSWLARQSKATSTGLTSEQVREKRRKERKQFKLDRAKAIATLAAEAETIFETEGRVIVPPVSGPDIPSGATWRPSPSTAADTPPSDTEDQETLAQEEDVEHLQLTLQEAFFLIWTLDCLQILDSNTLEPLSLQQIWGLFQDVYLSLPIPDAPALAPQFDNPFLIQYIVYHHYRSLGWVIKGGIKFCVDYLLYKRGPVFAHAEFAVVVCPVYEDPADQDASVTNLSNSVPFSWTWLSTINRVNTQVLKTLILTYVTIPARRRLNSRLLDSPACLAHYAVKEVVVRRFLPARMRD